MTHSSTDFSLATQKGFTLVEVLFALFFLIVGVFGVHSLIVNNQRIVEANKHYATALFLLQDGIVQGEAGSTEFQVALNELGRPAAATEQAFVRNIERNNTDADPDIEEVVVTVEWTDSLGFHKQSIQTSL